MDEATYATIKEMARGSKVEYWDAREGKWISKKPSTDTIRIPGVVHEGSTAFVGPKEKKGSLDNLYRPHGVANVVGNPPKSLLNILS